MNFNYCYPGDCREIMKAWPTAFADACIADPPYGDTGLPWDKVCKGWVSEVSRVLKPDSSIWVFGSMRFLVIVWPELEAAGFKKDTQFIQGARRKTIRRSRGPAHWNKVGANTYTSEDGGPLMQTTVIEVKNEHGKAIHPTQKPLGILAPLIRYSVPENGVVIDPFSGSGSVGVAAEMLGRQWVGCELNPDYLMRQHARKNQQPLMLEATA